MTAHDTREIPLALAPLAPGDDAGLDALRTMLADVAFPRTRAELEQAVGRWRVPVPGDAAVPLGGLLDRIPSRTYRSAESVVRAVGRAFPGLAYEKRRD